MEAEGLFRRPGSGGIGAGGQGCVVREDHRQIGLPPCGKADGGGRLSLLGRIGRDEPLPGRSRWKAAPAEDAIPLALCRPMGRGLVVCSRKAGVSAGGRPDPEGGLKKRLRLS